MAVKTGVFCDKEGFFNKYIDDCGLVSVAVTPQLLGAPFFRGSFSAAVIPTGFGNRQYSNLLPALRAGSERIERFVKNGGRLLVFGAMDAGDNLYDWLPFECRYSHEYFGAPVIPDKSSEFGGVTSDFDESHIEFDGFFESFDKDCRVVVKTGDGKAVMLEYRLGDGVILAASIHELPSREFLKKFCSDGRETVF